MASFRKRGTSWEYRITYTDRQTGNRKEKAKGGFKTKKEAQIAASEEESKINHFGFAENGDELISKVILRYANYQTSKDNLMFHQQDGRWLRTNVVRDYFKVVCKREGLPVLSPHALRHSHAVHLLEAGANIKYVSERLGHASVKVTADTYLHVTKKIEDDALELYTQYVRK